MRNRLICLCAIIALATPLLGEDLYLSIGGSTGNFHTDMRIFNPSYTKDIQVTAYLLSTGNQDNTNATTKVIIVGKRQMLVYNDVLTAIFGVGGLGGLRLKSDDDFVATQRIYAVAPDGSTTGQYIGGVDSALAKKKGVLLQIRNNGAKGQAGTFRTNVGVVNPNTTMANVTWRLYDRNNNLVGAAKKQVLQPFAVIAPTSVGAFADNCPTPATGPCTAPASADLTDAFLTFDSDQPLFSYASIVDNITDDGTLIPNYEDTGVQQTTPPTVTGKSVDVTLKVGQIILTPSPLPTDFSVGDTVTFRIHSEDVQHGFRLTSPTGSVLTDRMYTPADGVVEQKVTIPREGTFTYMCTVTTCSPQHNAMYGTFDVGSPSDGYHPGY